MLLDKVKSNVYNALDLEMLKRCTDISKLTRKQSKNGQARTRESEFVRIYQKSQENHQNQASTATRTEE
ncbi:hypothetical protein Tco_0093110 [Tanacetum coccineum]